VCYRRNGCRSTTRPSHRPGTDDDRPGFERRRRTPEQRRRVRTPKRACSSEGPDGSKQRGGSEQHGRRTICPSIPPLSRWSSHRDNSPSHQPPTPPKDHSASLLSLSCSASGDCFIFLLCSSPFCRYSFSLLCPSPRCFTNS